MSEHPFHKLIEDNDVDAIRAALGNDSSLARSTDANGRPILNHAVLYSRHEIVEVLLAHGADPDEENAAGQTSFHYAAQQLWQPHADVVAERFIEMGATFTPYVAARLGRAAMMAAFIEGSEFSVDELTALLHAAEEAGHANVGCLLIDAGATASIHSACSFGHLEEVKRRVEADASVVNAKRKDGEY